MRESKRTRGALFCESQQTFSEKSTRKGLHDAGVAAILRKSQQGVDEHENARRNWHATQKLDSREKYVDVEAQSKCLIADWLRPPYPSPSYCNTWS